LENEGITIRSLEPNDLRFIYATMLRGLYYGCHFYGAIEKSAFFSAYQEVLVKILSKTHLTPCIAVLTEDPECILGYSLVERRVASEAADRSDILHFIYVKNAWRKQGIAKRLLQGSKITTTTHITDLGNSIRNQRGWAFNPFLI
jgi:hypothetical protein